MKYAICIAFSLICATACHSANDSSNLVTTSPDTLLGDLSHLEPPPEDPAPEVAQEQTDAITPVKNEIEPTTVTNECMEPVSKGPCRARHVRYYFNTSTQQCASFVWGGCKAGANNFKSLEQCQNVCSPGQHNP